MSRLEDLLRGAHGCMTSPCEECIDVSPRVAFPACPHGDLTRHLDLVMIGLNPQLAGYPTLCPDCGDRATFIEYEKAGGCRRCAGETVRFVVPESYEAWRRDGAEGAVREFASKRVNLDRLERDLGRQINIANARYSPWPSRKDTTISFGARAGGHLLDFLGATKPAMVLVYSTVPWSFLQRTLVPNPRKTHATFVTSGASRKHWAESFGPTEVSHDGVSWRMAGVAASQAQDADYATCDGLTRRDWIADQIAKALLADGTTQPRASR